MRFLRPLKTVLQTLFYWPETRNKGTLLKAFILIFIFLYLHFSKERKILIDFHNLENIWICN